MNTVTLTGKQSDLRRVNLTRYASVIVTSGPIGYRYLEASVSRPSEAYLNTDGTVSISSRMTETGVSRVRGRAQFTGVTKDGEVEVINFV